MSGRQVKTYRRAVRKQQLALIRRFIDDTKHEGFFQRLKIALAIIRGK